MGAKTESTDRAFCLSFKQQEQAGAKASRRSFANTAFIFIIDKTPTELPDQVEIISKSHKLLSLFSFFL